MTQHEPIGGTAIRHGRGALQPAQRAVNTASASTGAARSTDSAVTR